MAIPDRIGRYRIVRVIGTGAVSTVFEAHDPDLDVPVAVKLLAENWLSREDVVGAFLREARLLRSIEDPRIVAVHDIGTLPSGQPYLVMDLLGGTLDDRLATYGPDAEGAVRVGIELCAALGRVHSAGLVHRDVKPANAFVVSDDAGLFPSGAGLVVGDFGLASSADHAPVGGTPGYMAPEQQSGAMADARADIFSIAAVVERLATGRDGAGALPGPLRDALDSGLATDPADRPGSVAEFARVLEDARQTSRPRRRSAVVLLAVIGIIAVGAWALARGDGGTGESNANADSGGAVDGVDTDATGGAVESGRAPSLLGSRGVDLHGDLVAVADTRQHRVVVAALGEHDDGSGFEVVDVIEGFRRPSDVAFDEAGVLHVADTGHHRIVQVVDDGLAVVAGTGQMGFSGDGGHATSASLASPTGIAFDTEGRLLIADTGNRRVRRVEGGTIATFVGTGLAADAGDGGPALAAALLEPVDIAAWRGGVAISDRAANRVRWVDADGTITTLAGTGRPLSDGDGGSAAEASLRAPAGLDAIPGGALYVTDSAGSVRRIERSGAISLEAAGVDQPWGVAAGNLLLVSDEASGLARIDEAELVPLLLGGSHGPRGDGGPAVDASFGELRSAAQLDDGRVVVLDSEGGALRLFELGGEITTAPAIDGLGGVTELVALGVDGDLVMADPVQHRVAEVDLEVGALSVLVGAGRSGDQGDGGFGFDALARAPVGVAARDGIVAFADREAHRVRRVDADGVVHTVLGDGVAGAALGAAGADTRLNEPTDVAFAEDGSLFVLDSGNERVLRLEAGDAGDVTEVGSGVAGGVRVLVVGDDVYVLAAGEVRRHLDADRWETIVELGGNEGDLFQVDGLLGILDRCRGTISTWDGAAVTRVAGRPIPSCS